MTRVAILDRDGTIIDVLRDEETGVVTRVVKGRTHRLSLEPQALGEAADWMDRQRALWERMFDVVDDYLKEEQR